MSGYAWVTLATNDSYSLGALVLAHSLKKSSTAHKLAVLITPAVSQPMREQLESVFDVVKTVDVLDSKDEAHLALMKRPELGVTFTKIHCWRLTEFEKCVFLDADTLVVRNCDELFQREEFSAAPDVSWPDCFNSGVFVYKPSFDTFNKLLQFAVEKGSFDGGDQGLLNQFFSDWATEDIKKHLPFVYNLTSVAAYSYIPAFKHYGAETRIVHFIGAGKPWLQQLDPATRTITPTSGSEHLEPLLQQWWDLFCEKVHPNLSKNLENNNDGMSHPHVEVCSNTPVALTSDEPQPPCLTEPYLQYREKDDYRQHNLPYQPFAVRGSSDELLNVEYLLISAVPSDELREQERGDKVEEKETEPEEQEKVKQVEQTQPEIVHDKTEEKGEEEEPPAPKDPFDYNTFFPDEKCVNNYLEQNVVTYQPFEIRHDDKQQENTPLPRFLTIPQDDRRQKGNIENVEYQPAAEPPAPAPAPPPPPLPPLPPPPPPSSPPTPTPTMAQILPVPPTTLENTVEVQKQPSPPEEKHELAKSMSMSFIPNEVIAESPSPPRRSIWTSLPNVNVDSNRKYSMPKLKPILPRQNSKITQTPIPRVTLYTEILMSADYKDPDNLPKDKVGFVEKELRRSKSEVDLKGKFGPLQHTKSPEIEIPEPKKSPFHNLHNDVYDLSRCKRQQGNKPRDHKKENMPSKLITPWKDKKTIIKKRKSKELSPNDGGKEKPLKKERKERQKRSDNVQEILKRLCEFSKNYQHYFGVNAQNGAKESLMQSEFRQFRNFVKDQKETTQKGLLGIKDIMKEGVVSGEKCVTELEFAKGNPLDKHKAVEVQADTNTSAEHAETIAHTTDQHEITNKKKSVESKLSSTKNDTSNALEIKNVRNRSSGNETTHENSKTSTKGNRMTTSNDSNQKEDESITPLFTKSTLSEKTGKSSDRAQEKPSHRYVSLSKATKTSSTEPAIPENTAENGKLMTVIAKISEDDLQSKNVTNHSEDSLYSSSSKTERKTSKVVEETSGRRVNGENYKELEYTEDEDEEVKIVKKAVETGSDVLDSLQNGEDQGGQETEVSRKLIVASRWNIVEGIGQSRQNEEDKNDEISAALHVNSVQEEMKDTMPSESQMSQVENKQSETQELPTPCTAEVVEKAWSEVGSASEGEARVVRKIVPDIPALTAPAEPIPKGTFTIGSPKENIEVNGKGCSHPDGGILCAVNLKPTEEVPLTTKPAGRIPKPDEILCVPDFDTPRSSRILVPISKPDTDATPQATPPSSPVATPRKARKQRKPYENGSKYRSPGGRKTSNGKHSAGIAGAIAQLNLEGNGQAASSEASSAAHQEYIRRQNWETGNMDYMGKDSFDNIWSKICQTLEGKELDKAGESTPTTISVEEKTNSEGGAGTEVPVSLATILQNCPEFIDTLPSETVTSLLEEDEIIFSKPENRQKCLTNIKEEEENNSAAEGESVRLSDILKPVLERPAPGGTVLPKELATDATAEVESDEKPQPVCTSTGSTSPTTTSSPISQKSGSEGVIGAKEPPVTAPELAKANGNPQSSCTSTTASSAVTDLSKPEAPILEIPTVQAEKPIKPEIAIQPPTPECTIVAIRQPLCIPGVRSEDQTPKTPGQKITEKKQQQQQQQPESPTEPIPLPAPESRNDCKTIAIAHPPVPPPLIDEKGETVKIAKEEKQKKGVFSKLLEMVGVVPKCEEASKSVFYDEGELPPNTEKGVEITEQKSDFQEANKEMDAESALPSAQAVDELKDEMLEKFDKKSDTTTNITEQTGADSKQETEDAAEPAKQDPDRKHAKASQAPMPKPARNSSPKSFAPKAPSSGVIAQTASETGSIKTTASFPPEPPKRRNSALLKVDETIPATPPIPQPQTEIAEPAKTEVENIIEKAKTEVESLLQDRRSAEKEASETSDLINTMRLMIGEKAAQPEQVEELSVTTEEERQRHKGEVVSSKLSDQILKAIPPPRRKAISESKSEASGSSGALPKTPAPSNEKPKQKPSSIPVPPPRSRGKPTPPPSSKGKTKK